MSTQFIGIKFSDEMLLSEECIDLCRHVSMVDRLLNDVQTFELCDNSCVRSDHYEIGTLNSCQ